MQVEVVFALPERQELVQVEVTAGTTVAEAIDRSGIAALFPGHDLQALPVGVWGRLVGREHRVAEGDRIEIYRPLEIDPREARRALAAEGRAMTGRRTR